MVSINVNGVMGAASMPHLAHAITMAIVLLHTTEAPQLSVFDGTRPFNSLGYVDGIVVFEAKCGVRPEESAGSLEMILYGCMGPRAIAEKVCAWNNQLNYTGRCYREICRGVRGKRTHFPLSKLVKAC